ncbi:esterase/lipase family protein [Rhabdothermincola sp.]|uniref:esterase/lipase family protein n=1 Tax=Rhabdothermincola sp. TaxID=2820405 RepID=UPI002FE1A34D
MRRHRRTLIVLALVFALLGIGAPFAATAGATTTKDPVIIVAGTFSPAIANEPLAARLRNDGYKVWIYELPGLGLGDIGQTSRPLATLVDQVRAQTGSAKVDLIGHSQGGLVARYYVKYLGGSAKVDRVISLGAPHYGTYVANIADFLGLGSCIGIVACEQMAIGSAFLNDLNAGPDVIAPVKYTNIYTAQDELVRPVTNATLRDGAENVKVQDQCWLRVVGHLGLILDGTVYDGVRDALRNEPVRFNCWAL